ncbi:phosphoadenylyl-sulfate reductase [Anaerolineales bacterium]
MDPPLTPPTLSLKQINTLNQDFENASPRAILSWAAQTFGDKLALVTSFQPTGIVTIHMLTEIAPATPILTLDTDFLFVETYALIDQMESQFHLNLTRLHPHLSVEQQAQQFGDKLWQRNPDHCCQIRKVDPLTEALLPFDAWLTGLRRDQSAHRATTPLISWDKPHAMLKICPFVTWTEEQIWDYIHAHDLPYNPLHDQNYPSIGCSHCTQPTLKSQDIRSGRWSGHTKTECGLHPPSESEN